MAAKRPSGAYGRSEGLANGSSEASCGRFVSVAAVREGLLAYLEGRDGGLHGSGGESKGPLVPLAFLATLDGRRSQYNPNAMSRLMGIRRVGTVADALTGSKRLRRPGARCT